MIVVAGTGLVGTHAAEQLRRRGHEVRSVSHKTVNEIDPTLVEVVLLAHGGDHARLARRFLEADCHVVSVSDETKDVLALLDLNGDALAAGRTLVLGAACSPGLSGLLVSYLSKKLDDTDEVHIAVHGTGGPECARQHHDVLSGTALGWHEDDWLRRPAGSGRELCWFPDPIGSRDCYRADLADPLLIKHAFPHLARISARTSATRRDRLTARLPMLTPPRVQGDMGALRVEVRGSRNGERAVEVAGTAHAMAQIAGSVAASVAHELRRQAHFGTPVPPGARALGDNTLPNDALLDDIMQAGVRIQSFYGVQ
jgi:hypothetical protein